MRTSQKARVRASALVWGAAWTLLLALPATAANWNIEMVDQLGPGRSSSLKVDKFGNVDVAFVVEDGNRNPLRYATWDHNVKKWFVMTLAEGVGTCSMVLDSKQNPHISYVDAGSGSGSRLRYIYWDGSAWKPVPILLNSDVISYYSSIVLDADDNPSITFYEYRGPKETDFKIRLRNVTLRDKYWQLQTVDGEEGSGKFNAMAIDPLGHMHIAYANVSATTASARYAYWNGQTWKPEIVDGLAQNNGQMVGFASAITLDKAGNPHIAYDNESSHLLKYAVKRNGRWQIQTVTAMSRVGYPDRNSIALDSKERPYISYFDAGRGTLNLAHLTPQGWSSEVVDRNGAGFASSLYVDDDNIWISYADDVNGGLKVAHLDLSGPAVTSGVVQDLKTAAKRAAK